MDTHEGEILIKEKYGSSSKERVYVKPTEQLNVVVLENEKLSDVASFFTKLFLPQGYPDSVSKDYIAYQIWDTAQAFCSTITGTLATQEVLRGVGVGDTNATPLAATITWVFKDGCGHLGKIIFAYSHGSYLDSYSKKWRLYADTLNDAAMCIEIALPLFRNYTTFALCVSTVMKAIVGVAGGATRAAMTQHHALRGNLADVSAKDSAQETAVNLVASFTALFIISVFGNSLFIFILMLVLHIAFNYFAVRAVCLRTLNEPRFLQVIDTYLKKEIISNPCKVNRNEPIIFYQLGPNVLDLKICGFQMKLGQSITQIHKLSSKASHLKKIKEIYINKKYILYPNTGKRIMYVFLKEHSSVDDVLCAYFHAVRLAIIICAINNHQLPVLPSTSDPKPFAQVCETLPLAEWSRATDKSGFNYEPSYELLRYMNVIATQEWPPMRLGLLHTGWDLSKHLLMVDEWRICGDILTTETTQTEATVESFSEHDFNQQFGDKKLEELIQEDLPFTIEPENSLSGSSKKKSDVQSKIISEKSSTAKD